jgi:signal transduction histidine kinase
MTALRNPVVLMLATGLLSVLVIVVGTNTLAYRAAEVEAVADARDRTELLAHSVVQPAVPPGLVEGRPGAIDRFDRAAYGRLLVTDVDRVKLWSADGRVVWSDETELIGRRYALGSDERAVLRAGRSDAEVSDVSRPENRFERGKGGLLEVYSRIESPEGEPLLFEVYFSAETVAQRQDAIYDAFRPIAFGALGLVLLVASGLLWALTRRLRRSAEERERLLEAAVDASDAERVRIARDLHDGVVQDLAGASFTVSALARSERTAPDVRSGLEGAGESLRTSLRALRSLLVEIYPPDLRAEGLGPALDDLLAPAAARGIEATASVDGVEGVSDRTLALVWRVAQEAVRNALRHSGACALSVTVTRPEERVVLEVTDDGTGFDTTAPADPTSFGLRGMNGLIADAGGSLVVRSAPGDGTTVRLEVEA